MDFMYCIGIAKNKICDKFLDQMLLFSLSCWNKLFLIHLISEIEEDLLKEKLGISNKMKQSL